MLLQKVGLPSNAGAVPRSAHIASRIMFKLVQSIRLCLTGAELVENGLVYVLEPLCRAQIWAIAI